MSRVIRTPSIDFELVHTAEGPMVRITNRVTGALIDHVDLELFAYMVGRADAEAELTPDRSGLRDDRWANEPS